MPHNPFYPLAEELQRMPGHHQAEGFHLVRQPDPRRVVTYERGDRWKETQPLFLFDIQPAKEKLGPRVPVRYGIQRAGADENADVLEPARGAQQEIPKAAELPSPLSLRDDGLHQPLPGVLELAQA